MRQYHLPDDGRTGSDDLYRLMMNSTKLTAISRLFSAAVFREMAKKGRSPAFARLLSLAELDGVFHKDAAIADVFDGAFSILQRDGHRDEYVYRAAILQKILLGKYSLKTASILNEFRAGGSKADMVLLNGTATAFEIKSERDSLTRLGSQIEDYRKVCASVNVIVSATHVDSVLKIVPIDVGVMRLSPQYRIQLVRDAIDRPERICPVTAFRSLRSYEAKTVLKNLRIPIPDVPNTKLHAAMEATFADLQPTVVHREIVKTIKKSRNLAPLKTYLEKLPKSLHAAAISVKLSQRERDRVVHAVSSRLSDAMTWGS